MALTYQQISGRPTTEQNALLRLADPNQSLIDAYLPQSTVYVASDVAGLAGVLVLKPQEAKMLEVMNLAVAPTKQHQGYGTAMVTFANQWADDHGYQTLRIATGTTSLTQLYLYQKCGFRVVRVEPDYFTQNYPQKITENGLILRDRLVLERPVQPKSAE
ncbi:GNAT family N-acetyltransferase [Levilactobacillus cerevisiae]|uniref:GNAT family N-acetyltransferase n=1 Tax=Levilactobacillus cerevisiae TaxID=1704076 RepID=UPI000F7B0C06|nr:GNAT family N-acetyltransferase [Levilactobacillus cerevisiae]